MIQRTLGERFCVWWWGVDPFRIDSENDPETGEEWMQHLAGLLGGWPALVETDNIEAWNGGEA